MQGIIVKSEQAIRLILEVKKKNMILKLFSTFCVNVKMQYTLNQRLFLVKQYWITNSITATQRAYQREFGFRNPPKRNTILGLVNKLETTGSLLQEPDKDKRLNYCRWFQTFIVKNPAILSITWNLWPPRSPDLTTPDNICYRGTGTGSLSVFNETLGSLPVLNNIR
ncbi:hypothetical protein ANN_14447 [Periplaneta americana]|uniref:DUF4817 domain-containing protein n=1 Tax=Periplaneta americana TaxID=6978 RepID=A0ABQ8SXU1_PERAM|nr:hypothetical protein ANN_14447 [Periplaneta americana]